MKRIIVHYEKDGLVHIHTEEGLQAEVISVCELSPGDRVYRCKPSVMTGTEIDTLIGDSPISSHDDERAPAMAARIEEAVFGKPRLSVVRPAPGQLHDKGSEGQ